MSQFSDERGAELRQLFFESAQELLQSLNEEALKLERHPGDGEAVRSIRRVVHTLKGDAAACGFRELSELAHELEDALALEAASSHTALAEMAFVAADTFGSMLTAYRNKKSVPPAETLRRMVRELAGSGGSGKRRRKTSARKSAAPLVWTEYERLAMQNAFSQGKRVYQVTARIDPQCLMPIAARQLLLNALAPVAEVLGVRPDTASPAETKRLDLLLASDAPAEEITARCHIPTVITQVKVALMKAGGKSLKRAADPGTHQSIEVRHQSAEPEAAPPALIAESDNGETASPGAADNILRVDAERIDNVLNLVGELIIGKSMLQQTLHEFGRRYAKDSLRGRFADAMAFQARVLNDLQRSVMKIRMVPVEQLFRRFPRMVRDLARQCGKEVELVISGHDTDLDKSILDAIAEPLTHLVRNAVSHGIEEAGERRRQGKVSRGSLRLNAYHQGNQVIVEVSDDGQGIDVQRVKAKAVEQGLVTSEEAARMSEAEALGFVFRPGFSTAEEITEVSGRGVGMDVVQSVVHRLKGRVEIDTHPGQGTTIRLKLPLTLAIIKALLFRVEQRLYAISLNTVAEIARARESDLHRVDNYEVLQIRDQVLPLVRLGRGHGIGDAHPAERIFVLVIALGERKLGLIVDGLEGEEELVIKALDDQSVATDLVSGASILGDGRVVLILNIAAISERYSKSRPSEAGATASGLLLSHGERAHVAQRSKEVPQ
ncbi:MAG TPA: chemotaxis protein CheA [Terriglobales bacterium]|nr:chemotaxis protein CheA [Terriglobales bacterium]